MNVKPQLKQPTLVLCQDLAAYADVAGYERNATRLGLPVPVFGRSGDRLQGFPSDTMAVPYEIWREAKDALPFTTNGDPLVSDVWKPTGHFCVSLNEPFCMAVSRFLSGTTGKSLVQIDAADWDRSVEQVARVPGVQSIAFVVPLWLNHPRELNPRWFVRTINLLREMFPAGDGPAWGIITGGNVQSLSLLVAKSVLDREIAAHYADAAAALVLGRTAHPTSLPRWKPGGLPAAIHVVDEECFVDGAAQQLAQHKWSALIFQGHGRSYCAMDGYLCGARRLEQEPGQPTPRCILDLHCADATYPQVDPRQYDSPVVVMDTCGAGNWGSRIWETGIPSLAFIAAAGAAEAVVASDCITVGDPIDTLWALATGATLGESTALLNRARAHGNIPGPFFLIGDPDIAAGSARWPRWVDTAGTEPAPTNDPFRQQWTVNVPATTASFVRFSLPSAGGANGRAQTLYVWPKQPGLGVSSLRKFNDEHGPQIWLGLAGSTGSASEWSAEWRPTPTLPVGLVEEALALPERILHWKPPLDEGASRSTLYAAAKRVLGLAQLLDTVAGDVVGSEPERIEAHITRVLTAWAEAQAGCVQLALSRAPEGLWPFTLWPTHQDDAALTDFPCPVCGLTPTVRRAYKTAPGFAREWWECMRCDLVLDRPALPGYPAIFLRAPAAIRPGQTIRAELEFDHTAGGVDCLGAGALVVERTGHGITPEPGMFPLRVDSGDRQTIQVDLVSAGMPAIPHLYRVRALVLLNGIWFWISHPLLAMGQDDDPRSCADGSQGEASAIIAPIHR